MGKMSSIKSFFQKLRFKYKLAILNENTLEEIWRIRLSRLSVISFGFFLAVVYFFLIALLIIKTPLRGFLPGYTENINLRKQLTLTSLVVDSIIEEVNLHTKYVTALRTVVSGEVAIDSSFSVDSFRIVSKEQLLDASERELAFRDSFEAQEIVSINLGIGEQQENRNYLMRSPAKGRVLEAFNSRLGVNGVSLLVDHSTSISSVLDGVVVSCEYSLNNFHVMAIQHPDNIVSIYKTHQSFLKKVGETVRAGEIISTFFSDADSYLEFQLWKEGVPMDPQSFIAF